MNARTGAGCQLLLLAAALSAATFSAPPLYRAFGTRGEKSHSLLRLAGAFRVFITDALWITLRVHQSEGREDLVLADARTLLELDPDDDPARAFLHWHLAFNLAAKAFDDEEREAWMAEGLALMDEGLARHPDSFTLNREMGLSLFTRSACNTAPRDAAARVFRRLCRARYGAPPVLLAPRYLERAWRASPDEGVRLFLLAALRNAAYYETARRAYGAAADRWEKVLRVLPLLPGEGRMEKQAALLRRYYRMLGDWCRIRAGTGTAPEGGAENLLDEIRSNPFYEDWEAFYAEGWGKEEKGSNDR